MWFLEEIIKLQFVVFMVCTGSGQVSVVSVILGQLLVELVMLCVCVAVHT